jgi:hypothetical protein
LPDGPGSAPFVISGEVRLVRIALATPASLDRPLPATVLRDRRGRGARGLPSLPVAPSTAGEPNLIGLTASVPVIYHQAGDRLNDVIVCRLVAAQAIPTEGEIEH